MCSLIKNGILNKTTKDGTQMEKIKKRSYTAEEKAEAVALAEELGSGTEAAKQLNIPEGTLYGWILKAQTGNLQRESMPKKGVEATDETERLRAEVKALKAERKVDKAKIEQMEKESKIKDDVIDFFVNRQKN